MTVSTCSTSKLSAPKRWMHAYTYSGHPLACAAALATLEVYREDGLFERAAELAPYWQQAVHSLRDKPHVVDIRNLGLVAGIELESRAGAVGARAMKLPSRMTTISSVTRSTSSSLCEM